MDEKRTIFNNFLLEQTVAHSQEENEQLLAAYQEYLNDPETVQFCIENISEPSSVNQTIVKLSHVYISKVNKEILSQFSEAIIELFQQAV